MQLFLPWLFMKIYPPTVPLLLVAMLPACTAATWHTVSPETVGVSLGVSQTVQGRNAIAVGVAVIPVWRLKPAQTHPQPPPAVIPAAQPDPRP